MPYNGGHCSVFKTSEGLAQVVYWKLLGHIRQSFLCHCQECQQLGVVIWSTICSLEVMEHLKWENILLLNWFTWKTNLIVFIRSWVQ